MSVKLISFPPVLPTNPKVLILGSMPGNVSLQKHQYYGNPRNHFWHILFELFQEQPIEEYGSRIEFVKRHQIALWDSIGSCYRKGSLDANIVEEVPNDIVGLLNEYPSISLIACNGSKSYQTLMKYFGDQLDNIRVLKLPSTSPIPGRYTKTFEGKLEAWREFLNHI